MVTAPAASRPVVVQPAMRQVLPVCDGVASSMVACDSSGTAGLAAAGAGASCSCSVIDRLSSVATSTYFVTGGLPVSEATILRCPMLTSMARSSGVRPAA